MEEKRRGGTIWLLLALAASLAMAVAAGELLPGRAAQTSAATTEAGSRLMDAVLDRLGVTQRAAFLDYLEAEGGELAPVWISRHGQTHFHSHPLCGGMKSPTQWSMGDAISAGYLPCGQCWGSAE